MFNAAPYNAAPYNAVGAESIPDVPVYHATAPVVIDVLPPSGHATAPIVINVSASGHATAPIVINVMDTEALRVHTARVYLGGVAIANVVGSIEVDAEAGAARTATWSMRLDAPPATLLAWMGQPVAIDFVRVIAGVQVPWRKFTGKVAMPRWNPFDYTVTFECVDDVRETVAGMSRDAILHLTGGQYSAGAQGEVDDNWDFAQAVMQTVAGDLDAGASGGPRVTPWHGLPVWRTFVATDLVEPAPSIELPELANLVNTVNLTYEYRYAVCRERRASIAWSGSIIGTDAVARGYQFPDLGAVHGAVEGLGWHVISYAWAPAYALVKTTKPAGAPDGADTDWWIVTGGGISNYSARLGQRHTQTVTETYTLTVHAPDAVAAHGVRARPLRAALSSEWAAEEWETDWSQTTPNATTGDVAYAPDATRSDSDHCLSTALLMARRQILESYRAPITFAVGCIPELDLDKAVALDLPDYPPVSGKITRVRDVLDLDKGEATSTLTIAPYGLDSVADDDLDPPAAPDLAAALEADPWGLAIPALSTHVGGATLSTPYSDSLMGHLVNAPAKLNAYNPTLGVSYTGDNPYYAPALVWPTEGFRAAMPGVAASHRNPIDLSVSATYATAIPAEVQPLT
jgi:hypothetical protein